MKRIMACTGLMVAVCALACAQNDETRVVIPPRSNGAPRVIEVSLSRGDIVVKTHSGRDVIAESPDSGSRSHGSTRSPDGMHRIDVPRGGGITVEELDSLIRIHAPYRNGHQAITLFVPVETSLSLKATMGDITVDGVHGELDVTTTHGDIVLSQISGTVVASSTLGRMKISMDRVNATKPLSFSSLNGDIDVTFPADLKANVKFKTTRGDIWTNFDVAMAGTPRSDGLHPLTRNNVSIDKTIAGTINGGGVEASFRSVNGKILIHKK